MLTADPTNVIFSVQTGEVRVRGIELEARGNVTRELEIIGAYSKLDPKVTKSNDGFVGNYLLNTALEQAALWAKYTLYDGPLAGLGIGGGVRYVGQSYGDNANTILIPDYTLFDATVSFDFKYLRPDLEGMECADQRDQSDQQVLRGILLDGSALLRSGFGTYGARHGQICVELGCHADGRNEVASKMGVRP